MALSLAFWLIVLFIAIVGAFPITQLVIGILHKDDCSMNHLIPIFLIVSGAAGLFLILLSICMVSIFFDQHLITKLILFGNIIFYQSKFIVLEYFKKRCLLPLFVRCSCSIRSRMVHYCK